MKIKQTFLPEAQVVERLGVCMEKMDVPPVHARIFVLLLLVDPPYMSFEEIHEHLQVSKSSVSKYINTMLEHGTLDYKTFSGDRKRYFYLNHDKLLNKIYSGASKFSIISELLEGCLKERESISTTTSNDQLKELSDFFKFLGEGMSNLVQEYQNNKKLPIQSQNGVHS